MIDTPQQALAAAEDKLRHPRRIKARKIARAMGERVARLYSAEWGMEIESCHKRGSVDVRASGHLHSHPTIRCDHSRLCPYCAAHDANERVRRYLPVAQEAAKRYRMQFVTLTTPSVPLTKLKAQEKRLWAWWTLLRRRDVWGAVAGSTVSIETTYSVVHGWHVHLHGLLAIDWDKNFDWAAVQETWSEISGAKIVRFQKVEPGQEEGPDFSKSLRELLKYPSKLAASARHPHPDEIAAGADPEAWIVTPGVIDWPDEAVREYIEWTRGLRTLRSYGVFYNPPEAPELQQPDDATDPVVATVSWEWTERSDGLESLLVFLIQGHKSTSGGGDPGGDAPTYGPDS